MARASTFRPPSERSYPRMEGTSTFKSAVAVVSGLDDLLLEILLRLPADSLMRFKSVCKHWRSLISDASFRRLHTRHHRNPQTSFLINMYKSQYFHFNPTSKNFVLSNLNFDGVRLLQSCKGLLLLECGIRKKFQDYYVLNPTTGESRNLLIPYFKNVRCLFLAFDPLKSPYYKVFCLNSADTCLYPLFEIEVYDSETHQWHPHNAHCSSVLSHLPYLCEWVYSDLNNSAYSITNDSITYEDRIICFDIENLVFGTPSLDAKPPRSPDFITESFGHVYCISKSSNDAMKHYVLNEITEKNGQWSFQHLFDFDSSTLTMGAPFLLGVIRGERKEEQYLVFHVPGKIMAYRFHERSFEELLDLSTFYKNGSRQFRREQLFSDCYQFVESLTPV